MAKASGSIYLVITLYAFFQIMTHLWPRHHKSPSNSIATSLLKRFIPNDNSNELQCEDVLSQSDQCAFVKEHCSDYTSGSINYLHFYFCNMKSIPVLALIVMGVWIVFLFAFIGITASDYFCSNLNTISKKLHLSESTTGVTFLAFGNASPDIFSTFSAIGAGSGTLAIGEVVGAAAFTTSVVVGSMMIAKPFEVYRKPFLRDTVVFTGCILFTLYIVISQKITFWQSIILIVVYVLYVALVVYGNCSNEGQGQEVEPLDSQYEQVPEEGEQKRISLQSTIDCEDGNGSQGNPDQRRFTIAIQDDLSHLDISNCNCRIPPVLSCDPKSPKPSTSWSPSTPINTYTHLPSSLSTTPKTSHSGFNLLGHGLGGCSCITPPTENGVSYAQFQQAVLHHSLILPDRSDPAAHPKSPIFQDSSRRHYFQENIPSITITTECASSVFNDWTIPVLFPTLLRWKEKTWWARLLSVGSIPIVFVLNLTLPVVDLVEATEAKEGCLPLTHDGREECSSLVGRDVIGEDLIFDNWCKSSTMIQMIFAPLLIATTTDVAGSVENGLALVFAALGLGILMSTLVYLTSTEEKPPRYFEVFAFVGFIVSMTWIFLVASEVVGVLRAFGIILGISDAILGLTVFAMGNSLGDLAANVTFARMGYPRMAFSACFGGPLLNMLLGVGISGLYVTLKEGKPVPIEISPTLLMSIGGVLVSMITMMVAVPLNRYVTSRTWGIFLVGIYFVFMILNVILEVESQ